MHYVVPVTVLPSNTVDNPVIEPVHLAAGTLTDVTIIFPPGCARLVRIQIYHGASQILPTTAETSYAEDANEIHAKEYLPFDTGSNLFSVVGWNTGASYRHVVNVYFEVRAVEELDLPETLMMMTEVLAVLTNRIEGYY